MGTPRRTQRRDLNIPALYQDLLDHAQTYAFDQIIFLIEALCPSATPIGIGNSSNQEALRIRSRTSFANPASEVDQLEFPPSSAQPVLWINFLGMAGIQGPLPDFVTEQIIERLKQKDTHLQDFLDIFNHRLASLLHVYRKKRYPCLSKKSVEHSVIGSIKSRLCGLDSAMERQLSLQDSQITAAASLVWSKHRSIAGLECWLSDIFHAPICIEPWQGAWMVPPSQDWSRLGARAGRHSQLGYDLIVGQRSFRQDAGIRIHIQNLAWDPFCALLPFSNPKLGGKAFHILQDACRMFIKKRLHIHVRMHVRADQIRPLRLNQQFGLGWNSWLTPIRRVSEDATCIADLFVPLSEKTRVPPAE